MINRDAKVERRRNFNNYGPQYYYAQGQYFNT
jgi:hypothetical protein